MKSREGVGSCCVSFYGHENEGEGLVFIVYGFCAFVCVMSFTGFRAH